MLLIPASFLVGLEVFDAKNITTGCVTHTTDSHGICCMHDCVTYSNTPLLAKPLVTGTVSLVTPAWHLTPSRFYRTFSLPLPALCVKSTPPAHPVTPSKAWHGIVSRCVLLASCVREWHGEHLSCRRETRKVDKREKRGRGQRTRRDSEGQVEERVNESGAVICGKAINIIIFTYVQTYIRTE